MIESVDNLINTFPEELRKNYYANKQSITIETKSKPAKDISTKYDNRNNVIFKYPNGSLYNELFYMAFRDQKKVNQHPWQDPNFYYDNGIAVTENNAGKAIFHGRGLNEGFAEYLSRKCTDKKNHFLNYYFTDLLISIYGEEILNYPLKNDPEGLFSDERFSNIYNIYKTLDEVNNAESTMLMIARNHDKLKKITLQDRETKETIVNLVDGVKNNFKTSIINLFNLMINEYENSQSRSVDNEHFIKKLEEFVSNDDYKLAFTFDKDGLSVKDEVNKIIENYKLGNKKGLPR